MHIKPTTMHGSAEKRINVITPTHGFLPEGQNDIQ